jgi:hypothetical protein
MWSKRIFTCILVLMFCTGTSFSAGTGIAAAFSIKDIMAMADNLGPMLAGKFGASAPELKAGFISQADGLTPVRDTAALNKLAAEWEAFTPRAPRPREMTVRRAELPGYYREAANLLCQTTADLLVTDDKSVWEFAINQVDGHITSMIPAGRNLALYGELNDIADKFQSGCYCAATAKLAVVIAKNTYC